MKRPNPTAAVAWSVIGVCAVLVIALLFVDFAFGQPGPHAQAIPQDYTVTVSKIIDGDSFDFVRPSGWPAFVKPEARIAGIDTPEHILPPAQTRCEVALGLAATVFAKTILRPGDVVVVHWDGKSLEKYGRLLGTVTLPDRSDYGAAMIAHGSARAYGGGHKPIWCADPSPKP